MPRTKKPRAGPWYTDARWIAPLAVLVVGAVVWAAFRFELVRWIYRDGDTIWDSRDRLNIRSVLWSPPRALPETRRDAPARGEGGEAREDRPAAPRLGPISAASLLVAVRSPDGDYDIHVRELTRSGWTDPAPLGGPRGALHSPHDEITPRLSPDGAVLYFASDRPGGLGGFDLYASRLGPDGPEKPVHLGSHINSPFDDLAPAPHPSGRLLAFATTRPRSFLLTPPAHWDDVPLENWQAGDEELAYALGPENDSLRAWSDPQPMPELNSAHRDTTPAFSPGGTFLYYASARPGGSGGLDLYRARCRAVGLESDDEITRLEVRPAENVGPPVNTRLDDSHPALFLEGFALAYRVADAQRGVEGFFESRSHEVAPELSFAAIPMEVVTAFVVRIGGMILAGGLFVLLTVLLLRYRRFWSLSLSLRCAAAAILIHIAMFYGFYLWKVGSDIAQLRPRTVLAEVTIERTLQAKLTLEAQRIDIELPDQEPAAVDAAQPRRDFAQLTNAPSTTAVEARVFSVESPESLPVSAAPALAAAPPVRQSAPRRLEVTRVENVAAPRYEGEDARMLPQAEPLPPTPDTQVAPSGVASSLKVETDGPRPGPVATVVAPADAQSVTVDVVVQEARTQVQAPVPDPKLLPPLAEPDPKAVEIVHELPLPAQTSETEAPTAVAPAPAAAEPSARAAPQLARVSPATTLPVDVAAASRVDARWSASPAGLARVREDLAEATEFAQATLQPLHAAAPIPSAAAVMPELAAVGETASSRDSASRSLAPRAGERRIPSMATHAAPASSAPVVSAVSLSAMAPKTAPSEASTVVTAASPAPLRSLPVPGSFAAPPLPAAAPALPGTEVRMPEGEGGSSAARGAADVADVLGASPPRARLQKISFSREQAAVPPPRVPTQPAETAPSTWSGDRPLAAEARARPAAPEPQAAPPEPLSAAHSSALAAVMSRFPEQSPKNAAQNLREVRSEPSRRLLVDRMGGTPASEEAVHLGLEWLARNQSRDGRWDIDGFSSGCSDCGTPGFQTRCDVAVTGLAVLCFLGQNHTHTDRKSPYRHHVSRGIRWLLQTQTRKGVLAGDDTKHVMYNHGIATLALSEAYILTGDAKLREPLERAAAVIVQSQNPRTGGWRYQPSPPIRGDTSITGWQVMALTSVRNAGIYVPGDVFDLARHWLDEEVSSGRHKGIYGYTRPEEARVAMVAEGMFVRQLLGSRRSDLNVEESARYIHTQTVRGNNLDNLYLIYYGTLGLYQYQGWIWERWNTRVREFLVSSQHKRGRRAGSWDPTGPWSEAGGSVLSTCFSILSLQVYYRYLPLFWQPGETAGGTR